MRLLSEMFKCFDIYQEEHYVQLTRFPTRLSKLVWNLKPSTLKKHVKSNTMCYRIQTTFSSLNNPFVLDLTRSLQENCHCRHLRSWVQSVHRQSDISLRISLKITNLILLNYSWRCLHQQWLRTLPYTVSDSRLKISNPRTVLVVNKYL